MQKNVPKYTPDWVPTVRLWAEASKREVAYAVCNDRRTLLWFANQRAVEYHPTLTRIERPDRATHLVLDLDPPEADAFSGVVAVAPPRAAGARRRRAARSGQDEWRQRSARVRSRRRRVAPRGLGRRHPRHRARAASLDPDIATTAFIKEDREGKVFVDSTRVAGATVVSVYSPRVRPGVPVSFPVEWDELDGIAPRDFTVHTALEQLEGRTPWAELMADRQSVPASLVEEGHEIPVARVQAMHEGKRRARARRTRG